MPSWLCKIWRFVANVLGKIVDFVLDVVKKIVGFAVEALKSVADALFDGGGLLLLAAVGLGIYFLFGRNKDSDGTTVEVGEYGQ